MNKNSANKLQIYGHDTVMVSNSPSSQQNTFNENKGVEAPVEKACKRGRSGEPKVSDGVNGVNDVTNNLFTKWNEIIDRSCY